MNALNHFRNDLKVNCFKESETLLNNYGQLLSYKKYHNTTLDDISKDYLSGSNNPYINAIGNELRAQELLQYQETAVTLEPEP